MASIKKSYSPTARAAQIILVTIAALALFAGIGALKGINLDNKDTLVIEIWRMIGLFTFAGLFTVLAQNPKNNRSLWIVVILNKLALAAIGGLLMIQSDTPGASDLIIFDGAITLALLVASLLAGTWQKKS